MTTARRVGARVAAALLTAVAGDAAAQTEGRQLRGLETLRIAVAPLSEAETRCGLTETRIRATAHNLLRSRQISLANEAETVLLFEASSLADEDVDRCFTGLQAVLYREAAYFRESDATVASGFALLWSDLRLAVSPVDDHALFVLGQVQGQLDLFLEDLQRDNGPQ